MNFFRIISLGCGMLVASSLYAQNDADALRFSMFNYGSTARSLGMGNSFGALGADFSSMAINPAGIGLYRRSEFSISPQFSNRGIDAKYIGQENTDNYFKFAFGNLGLVLAKSKNGGKDGWKGVQFAVGYNRTNDFSGRYIAEAGNGRSSLLDSWLEDVNGIAPDNIPNAYPFDVDLAWQTFLIDTASFNGDLFYFSALPYAGALQRKTVETRGGAGEWDFTFGGNYNDELYVGFTLGACNLRYVEESTWQEEDNKDTIPFFTNYTFNTNLNTTGSGVNVKFGLIYRPSDFFRLGIALHSPTWYNLTDEYATSIQADLQDGVNRTYDGPVFIPFQYNVTTPFRAVGSAAFLFAKQGAINIDYELVDYSMARIRPDDRSFVSDFTPVNRAIRNKYTISHNVRAGFEWRYEELRFRAGGFYSTSPFEKQIRGSGKTDLSRYGLTGGFGFRNDRYFFDAAYAWSRVGSFARPYTLSNQDTDGITFRQTDNRFLFTVGWFF